MRSSRRKGSAPNCMFFVECGRSLFFSCDCAHERYTLHSIYSDNDDNEWNSHERDYVRLDTVLTRTLYNQTSTVLY